MCIRDSICPYDPYAQDLTQAMQPPSAAHLMGTDTYGRDMLSRVLIGAQTSISSTFALVAIITVFGTVVGIFCGYYGGIVDSVMMRISDVCLAFPGLSLIHILTSCAKKQEEQHIHKIGVVVYDLKDEQVQAFREYLEGYIGENFSDVDFLYSAEVTTEEQEMQFLNDAIAAGVEGIMAFNSFDLEKEVELCAENGVYFIRPSSTTDPETFDKIANNPYFLGYFGPRCV